MREMFDPTIIIAVAALIGLAITATALLVGWRGWLALKERELVEAHHEPERGSTIGAARIEISDLKERIRKLEAIASGVEL